MNKTPFGDYLDQSLRYKSVTASQLADFINRNKKQSEKALTAHTIAKWRHERVPSQKHTYAFPWIAMLLCVDEAVLRQKFRESLVLQASRGSNDSNDLGDLQRELDWDQETLQNRQIKDFRRDMPEWCNSLAIRGVRALMETAICMLEELGGEQWKQKGIKIKASEKIILMSFQSDVSALAIIRDLEARWYTAIKLALQAGWTIHRPIRINYDWRIDDVGWQDATKVTMNLAKFIGQPGDYHPYIFRQGYEQTVATSLMLIPALGEGLVSFATLQPHHIDSSLYTNDAALVGMFVDHFEQIKRQTTPIFTFAKHLHEFRDKLIEADKRATERIVISKGLTHVMGLIPELRCLQEFSDFYNLSKEQLCSHLEMVKSRHDLWQSRSESYLCKEIYTQNCVSQLIHKGVTHFSKKQSGIGTDDKIELLDQITKLLELPNYEIALLDEDLGFDQMADGIMFDRALYDLGAASCEVIGRDLVILEIHSHNKRKKKAVAWLLIENPVIVHAMHVWFHKLWENIPDHRRDRHEVRRSVSNAQNQIER
jgi:hypothetical protein